MERAPRESGACAVRRRGVSCARGYAIVAFCPGPLPVLSFPHIENKLWDRVAGLCVLCGLQGVPGWGAGAGFGGEIRGVRPLWGGGWQGFAGRLGVVWLDAGERGSIARCIGAM